jgi:hypothetical protein
MRQTNATYRRSESAAASRILDSQGVVLGTRMQGTKRGLVADRRLRVPVHLRNREPLSSSRLSRNSGTAMPLRLAVPLSASSNFFEIIIELH